MSIVIAILTAIGLLAAAFLCLTVLVVVHELGHFILAKLNGVWVEEFGVGLPPRVWSKKIGETVYSLNAIPLGGFVRLHGETGMDEIYDPKRAFVNKGTLAKSLIIIAGIVVNFIFGVFLFAVVYSFVPEEKVEPLGYVQVVDVIANSPAQTAGILVGDIVKEINDQKVSSNEEIIKIVAENKGKKIKVDVEREVDGQKQIKTVSATLDEALPSEGKLGIQMADSKVDYYFPPWYLRPIVGAKRGLVDTFALMKAIFFGFGQVATEASAGKVPEGLMGPVKMIAVIAYIIKQGILPILNLTAIISINLAVFNILPIPPLDGSRLMVILGEKLFGKKLSPKIENFVNMFGMVLLLGLVLFVTFREVPQFISAGSLNKFVEESLKLE